MEDGVVGPVDQWSTVVYLIDDTMSQRGSKALLKPAFLKLLSDWKDPLDHVRVAALRHTNINTRLDPVHYDSLGGERYGPYMFSPDPHNPGQLLRYPSDPFKAVATLSDTLVADAIDDLDAVWSNEFLYAGIDLARRAIEKECPKSDHDLLLNKPWCYRKVIVVLGDGDPGTTRYHQYVNLHDKLATDVLNRVNDYDIEVHTLCFGSACDNDISYWNAWNVKWHYFHRLCPTRYPDHHRCIYRGGDLMRKIAEYTGGKFYGVVPHPTGSWPWPYG